MFTATPLSMSYGWLVKTLKLWKSKKNFCAWIGHRSMRNAISTFSIFEFVNPDLKSLKPRALKLPIVILCRTLLNDRPFTWIV